MKVFKMYSYGQGQSLGQSYFEKKDIFGLINELSFLFIATDRQ